MSVSPSTQCFCGVQTDSWLSYRTPAHSAPHTRLFQANEEEEPEKKEVSELRSELWEKEMKLTDIRLEALNSAHQLDQLRETMHNMQVSVWAELQKREAGPAVSATLPPALCLLPTAGGGPAESRERPAEGCPRPLLKLHSRAGPWVVCSVVPSPFPGPCTQPSLQSQFHRHRYLLEKSLCG